jgi:hypothetical protein
MLIVVAQGALPQQLLSRPQGTISLSSRGEDAVSFGGTTAGTLAVVDHREEEEEEAEMYVCVYARVCLAPVAPPSRTVPIVAGRDEVGAQPEHFVLHSEYGKNVIIPAKRKWGRRASSIPNRIPIDSSAHAYSLSSLPPLFPRA